MSVLEYEVKDTPMALLEFKQGRGGAGSGTALFSRYDVVDLDNDLTRHGFLPHNAVVPLLVAHQWSEIPVGKGKIRSERDAAYYDFELAHSARGRELAEWLRLDLSDGQPKSEWSYGFTVYPDASRREMVHGKSVRVLHARPDGSPGALVKEVSYVLAGAGVGTQLVMMKGEQRYRWQRRHAELTAQIAARERQEQAEMQRMYDRFMQRERELHR